MEARVAAAVDVTLSRFYEALCRPRPWKWHGVIFQATGAFPGRASTRGDASHSHRASG